MPEAGTAERTFYGSILDEEMSGLEKFREEDFVPTPGTVLVVLPPKISQIKGIHLPDSAQEDQSVARVAAVPVEPGLEGALPPCGECPVCVGDWVVFRAGALTKVAFQGRKDLALLQYSMEADSEIYGIIPRDAVVDGEAGFL